jgi:hypothetical protein
MKYVFESKGYRMSYKRSFTCEDIQKKLMRSHELQAEVTIRDKKGAIMVDLDGHSINNKTTYHVEASQRNKGGEIKADHPSDSEGSLSTSSFVTGEPPVLPQGPFITKVLTCIKCKQYNVDAVFCQQCEMPACQVCFDASIKQHHKCPWGCGFVQSVKPTGA